MRLEQNIVDFYLIWILVYVCRYWNNVLTSPIFEYTATSDEFKHSPKQPFAVHPPVLTLTGREI